MHWWFKSRAHAAELTAGYYNTRDRDGYDPVFAMLAKYNARVSFTCVEMRDCEHPPEGKCSPQGLLQQVIECGERHGISLAGENALQRCVPAALGAACALAAWRVGMGCSSPRHGGCGGCQVVAQRGQMCSPNAVVVVISSADY